MEDQALSDLATYRLDRGWSVRELAEAMAASGWPLPFRTLHRALTNPKVTAHETTLHWIRRYVEHERKAGRLPWKAEKPRKAKAIA